MMKKEYSIKSIDLLILFLTLPLMMFITYTHEQKVNGTTIITGGNDMANIIPRAMQINDPSLFSIDHFFNTYMGKTYPQIGIYAYAWMLEHTLITMALFVVLIIAILITILHHINIPFHDKLNMFLCILCITETLIFYLYNPTKEMMFYFITIAVFFLVIISYLYLRASRASLTIIKSKLAFHSSQFARWLTSAKSQWVPARNIKTTIAVIIMLFSKKILEGEHMKCPKCNQEVPTTDSAFYAKYIECMACQIHDINAKWL